MAYPLWRKDKEGLITIYSPNDNRIDYLMPKTREDWEIFINHMSSKTWTTKEHVAALAIFILEQLDV